MRGKFNSLFIFSLLVFFSCSKPEVNNVGEQNIIANKVPSEIVRDEGQYSRQIDWKVDTTHSSVLFRTKHTSNHDVIGWVSSYEIQVTAQKHDFSDAQISGTFNMNSIVMPNPEMAKNVMSPLFINSDSFPQAKFESEKIEYFKSDMFKIRGIFSMMGKTKPLELDAKFNGFAHPDNFGLPGFKVTGKFSRFDYGVDSRDSLEFNNEPIIDDTIRIEGNFRLYAQPAY
jgi:polyisoprenoid-binding protein YceI